MEVLKLNTFLRPSEFISNEFKKLKKFQKFKII